MTSGKWIISDRENGRAYVAVEYKTQESAHKEMMNLLRPYPEGHEWRLRLHVVEKSSTKWLPLDKSLIPEDVVFVDLGEEGVVKMDKGDWPEDDDDDE